MTHSVFTIITPVVPDAVNELYETLNSMGYLGVAPLNDPLNFQRIETLHYASLFLYDDPQDGWFLVFESNIDGDIDDYFAALIAEAQSSDQGRCLLGLYRHCRGFENRNLADLATYWRAHVQMPSTAYVGAKGRTCRQILLERRGHQIADETLGAGGDPTDPRSAAQAVQSSLRQHCPEYGQLADGQGEKRSLAAMARTAVDWSAFLASALVFLVLAVYNLGKEAMARQDTWRPDGAQVRSQRAREDFLPTNHMVSVVHLHDDWSRLTAKKAAFQLLQFLARYKYTHGRLGSIPTIHFAHWSIINNGRRLLFVSNFDGSWDSYLDDFTLKAARGLTLAWSHGVGFPRSRFMLSGGAANGPEFIDWARRSMVPTLVWYSAYQGISVATIDRNTRLRAAIASDRQAENKDSWLSWV